MQDGKRGGQIVIAGQYIAILLELQSFAKVFKLPANNYFPETPDSFSG